MIINYTIEGWKETLLGAVVPRLKVVHGDLTRMAAALRDVNVDVWTETPTDETKLTAGRTFYSLEGWRNFYRREYQQLNQFNTANGASVLAYDAAAKAAIDGYLATMPILSTAFNTTVNNYKDGSGNVIQQKISQTDRNTLATAIEGQLL